MARKSTRKTAPKPETTRAPIGPRVRRVALRMVLGLVVLVVGLVAIFSVLNPPTTPYMMSESRRLGGVDHEWVPMEDIAPVMARSAVAAEDANFCEHWGFDVTAIRAAIEEGGQRGASTITQQVVKNVFLWQGRSWPRKAMEAVLTPMVELFWTKRRILEVYLNVAEFGPGVFGIDAAAHDHFGVPPSQLTQVQAARLSMILPNPRERDPANPTPVQRSRSAQIYDGAATIERDGRAACFS